MSTPLSLRSIAALAAAYDDRSLSPVEVVTACLDRINAVDGLLRTFLTVLGDTALEEARVAEKELARGYRRGPLHGIPVGLKDLIDVAGVSTTGGSRSHRSVIAGADAVVVRELRASGAVILGKNNLYELGTGLPLPGDWPAPARNPWDTERIPGGSSSGSAVAVSAGLCTGSYGTDTGGSIRGPASYCGVVGLKPTYDAISRDGVLALSWSLDHVGPIGRTVDDVASLLAGATGTEVTLGASIDGLRVGVPESLVDATEMEPDIREAFGIAVNELRAAGARVTAVELPDLALTEAILMAIIGSEGLAAHLPALAEHPELFGASARERISAGLAYSGVDYVNALRSRDVVVYHMAALFREVNVIVSPVVTQVAPTQRAFEVNPPHRTPFTGIHNLIGGPAVSLPAGYDRDGMPIGMQIAGPPGADAQVLTAARAYERRTAWHRDIPPGALTTEAGAPA
jgi:aspartyl-tRNA(Asn)/glutamyl-tRNA(Gln) amidotransferase subunit A